MQNYIQYICYPNNFLVNKVDQLTFSKETKWNKGDWV